MIAHRVGKGGIGAAQESPPKRGVKRYSDISNNRTSATEIQALFHYPDFPLRPEMSLRHPCRITPYNGRSMSQIDGRTLLGGLPLAAIIQFDVVNFRSNSEGDSKL